VQYLKLYLVHLAFIGLAGSTVARYSNCLIPEYHISINIPANFIDISMESKQKVSIKNADFYG
jgi:hypothetical protein